MSTCPHITTDREGTSHCRLAEREGQTIADLHAQLAAANAEITQLIEAGNQLESATEGEEWREASAKWWALSDAYAAQKEAAL
jgi:hypothetical protein